MKAKSIVNLLLVAITPLTSSSQFRSGGINAVNHLGVANSARGDTVQAETPAPAPSTPGELLQNYEAEMAAITLGFSEALAGITAAVQRGELTGEQGQRISAEQYERAEMQFELVGAWRAMLEHDLARVPGPAAEATPAWFESNEIATAGTPFSSFQLNASIAEYLRLSEPQAQAIRQVLVREGRNLQPLIAQLRATREELLAADHEHTREKDIKALADKHAAVLAKLIVANARMHSDIYKLLTPEQQRKLDNFTRSGERITSR